MHSGGFEKNIVIASWREFIQMPDTENENDAVTGEPIAGESNEQSIGEGADEFDSGMHKNHDTPG